MIRLVVDARENAIREIKPDYEYQQLDVGDFQITIDNLPKIVIERKTISDLESSVKDNRYKEQKLRALEFCKDNGCKYILLLEGVHLFTFGDESIKQKMLSSCILNTLIRDDIKVLYSKSLKETTIILDCLLKRISNDPDKYFLNNEIDVHLQHQEVLVKQKKKQNICTETCFLMQLSTIPGISINKAKAILIAHPSITNIYDLCLEMKKNKPAEFFKDVKGVGKILQNTIYEFCGVLATKP